MRALILCGGFATRLSPITFFLPKALLPIGIGGKPIIEYIVEDLYDSGIKEITISTNSKFVGHFKYWAERKYPNIKYVVENTTNHNEKYGQIKGIEYAIDKQDIDEDLIIIAGDNFYDFTIKNMIERSNSNIIIGLYNISSLKDAERFGVVATTDEDILSFQEKPTNPQSTIVSTGIYFFPKNKLRYFKDYLREERNMDSIGYFIEWLLKRDKIKGYLFKGEWYDVGTLETYKKIFERFS